MVVAVRFEHQSFVYATGNNRYGQLGQKEFNQNSVDWVEVHGIEGKTKQVCCGDRFSVAVNKVGKVFQWGAATWYQNRVGSLRITKVNQLHFPSNVLIQSVSCGKEHVAAISYTGGLFTWGCGKGGRLGLGTMTDRTEPTLVPLPQGVSVTSVGCGKQHTSKFERKEERMKEKREL